MDDTQYVYEITIASMRTDTRRTVHIVAPDLRTACGYAGWLMDWADPHERVSGGTELETLPARENARRAEDAIDAGTYQPPDAISTTSPPGPEPSPSDVAYDDMTRAWRNGDHPLAWQLADALLQYLANGGQPL